MEAIIKEIFEFNILNEDLDYNRLIKFLVNVFYLLDVPIANALNLSVSDAIKNFHRTQRIIDENNPHQLYFNTRDFSMCGKNDIESMERCFFGDKDKITWKDHKNLLLKYVTLYITIFGCTLSFVNGECARLYTIEKETKKMIFYFSDNAKMPEIQVLKNNEQIGRLKFKKGIYFIGNRMLDIHKKDAFKTSQTNVSFHFI